MNSGNSTTVLLGMSGGVDSSVAAALLLEQGYRVIGLFMRNWEETDANGVCQASREFEDVARVCEKLGIPYYSVDFVKEYRDRVFARFLSEYEAGHTPNPDILCNREIKFDVFYEKMHEYGADYLATGHYCRTEIRDGQAVLLKGLDPRKDQSYFLHAIDGQKLKRVLFPVGAIEKSEVRAIAAKYGLSTQDKKDSTGICFIGERDFKPFLAQYLKSRPGDFRRLDGSRVGRHTGVQFYTLGQRRGLGLGGEGEPWFVVGKDITKNVVWVERGETHPALYTDRLWAEELTWIAGAPPASPEFSCRAKVRYRQGEQECHVRLITSEGGLTQAEVSFPVPQRAVTPGQSVAFYDGDVCLGGGVIRKLAPSFYERGLTVPAGLTRSTWEGAERSASSDESAIPTKTIALET